jgi:Flp pilus assembly protein TadG
MRSAALSFLRLIVRDRTAATAGEFALVVPLLFLFLCGIIDVGRLMYDWNTAEKATQMGVRFAVVTAFVPSALASKDFTTNGVTQGSPVNSTLFPGVSCTGTNSVATCTCKTGSCAAFALTGDSTAFNNIVNRMNLIDNRIAHANVVVDYDPSGLGFAGNPHGPDVAPIVTIRLRNITFTPILGQVFGASVNMPDFPASLTMEDGAGTVSN